MGEEAGEEMKLYKVYKLKSPTCCKGRKRTAYGYIWRYADDKEIKRTS
jgi:hypothetical protein